MARQVFPAAAPALRQQSFLSYPHEFFRQTVVLPQTIISNSPAPLAPHEFFREMAVQPQTIISNPQMHGQQNLMPFGPHEVMQIGIPQLSAMSPLDRVKKRLYCSCDEDTHNEVEECPICYAEYNDTESIGTLDCGHEFHVDCLRPWLIRRNTCPMCRREAVNMD